MIKDISGRLIEIGDIVAYPVRSGSSMWMTVAEVENIITKTRPNYKWNPNSRRQESDGVIEYHELKIKGQHSNWNKTITTDYKATVRRIDRVVIVTKWSDR